VILNAGLLMTKEGLPIEDLVFRSIIATTMMTIIVNLDSGF
jgi:hypothetical protein